ncbi:MAG TPA: thermonuclease family protein [Eoetvoesiella sp.]|uniref:thermonuclease family protein n=1 Tax=Eoetvoesiella sp. TaxID=1966355 RepID=UPI002C18AC0E|nr:thermonuclease family protein [Eoetvoesiella sp.]HWK62529.1 thermonuclease family protein [Eoetvoesiella sp.]
MRVLQYFLPPGRWYSVRLGLAALALVLAGQGAALAYEHPAAGGERSHIAFHLRGRVVHVADGDTFTIMVDGRQQRVRMASIDAPETGKGRERPGQPMGQASKKALADLIAGKTLALDCYEKDQYGRNVCNVPLADGSTANQRQVAAGMAWANMEGRGKFMRDPSLPGLEQKAREARLGLWRDPDPVKPWAWRYGCWKKGRC